MVLGGRVGLHTLSEIARALGTMLHSGLPIVRALELLTRKSVAGSARPALLQILREVQRGLGIADAFRLHARNFPPLFVDLVDVGEQSGALPEVLFGLAAHYDQLVRLRRAFLTQIAWPVFQLLAAIGVVAVLIYILGIIAAVRQTGPPVDILGWGLVGTKGAIVWLLLSLGSLAGLGVAYWIIAHVFRQQRALDRVLLSVPVVGNCLRSFALARFAWSFSLTQQTGMPIGQCLQASFRSTNNGVFTAAGLDVVQRVLQGQELGEALASTRLFPEEFLEIVHIAEASGTVPEALARLSPEFEAQAQRSLQGLAVAAGWLIWCGVATLIIFIIFSIFAQYLSQMNDALRMSR